MAGFLVGRETELRALGRFLQSLSGGPAACVLEGPAGIGKTALWRGGVALAESAGYLRLRCAPAELEVALSYASLVDLLADVPAEVLAALPLPQRDALEV